MTTNLRTFLACVVLLTFLAIGLLAGCARSAPAAPDPNPSADIGSCGLGLSADSDDPAAITAVLLAEGKAVVSQDIDALMRLWAEDSRVSDAKNTPDDDSDDQNWEGKDAIRHRYVRTVFPGAPDSVQPSDLVIAVEGDQATVTATTRIGDEVSPAGDQWQLTKSGDCWLILSLTYNLEP